MISIEDFIGTGKNMNEQQPKDRVYSYTMLTTFRRCRYAFYNRYIQGKESKIEGLEKFVGSRVHDAIQYPYIVEKEEGKVPSLSEIFKFYSDKWEKEVLNLRKKGKFLVAPQKIDGLTIPMAVTNGELNDAKSSGWAMVEQYYKEIPFQENMEVEKQISFTLEGRRVIVKIDGFVNEGSRCKVFEFKTSQDQSALNDWKRQVSMYILGVNESAREEGHTVEIEPFLIHLPTLTRIAIPDVGTPEDLADTKRWILSTIMEIERVTRNWSLDDPKEYPCEPLISNMCPWCEFFEECPRWKHRIRLRKFPEEDRKNDDGVRLVQEYISLQKKLEDTEKRIKEYAQLKGISVIDGLGANAYISRVLLLPDRKNDKEKYEALENELKSLGMEKINEYYTLNTYQLRSDLAKGKLDPDVEKVVRKYVQGEDISVFIRKEDRGKTMRKQQGGST